VSVVEAQPLGLGIEPCQRGGIGQLERRIARRAGLVQGVQVHVGQAVLPPEARDARADRGAKRGHARPRRVPLVHRVEFPARRGAIEPPRFALAHVRGDECAHGFVLRRVQRTVASAEEIAGEGDHHATVHPTWSGDCQSSSASARVATRTVAHSHSAPNVSAPGRTHLQPVRVSVNVYSV
jgi:hypothetical protein